jgi:hypothetical protein
MGKTNGIRTGLMASIHVSISFLVIGACLFASGCETSRKSWSAESRSPDGKYIAHAERVQTNGMGVGDPQTFVFLNWTAGSQSPALILSFEEGENESDESMSVGMNWLTPTHLEVTYRRHRTFTFEAVTWYGVEISMREVPAGMALSPEVRHN